MEDVNWSVRIRVVHCEGLRMMETEDRSDMIKAVKKSLGCILRLRVSFMMLSVGPLLEYSLYLLKQTEPSLNEYWFILRGSFYDTLGLL